MTRPITRLHPEPSSQLDESTNSSSPPSLDPMLEMLAIMRRLEQRLNETDQRLTNLEALEVPDPSTFFTPQDIDALITAKFDASYGPIGIP